MCRRLFLAFVAILALLSPSRALEVEKGECQRILSGQARVRIHYTSGLKVEVDPLGLDNIMAQIEILPDGRRVPQKWLIGGSLLPLESPHGRFVYAEPTDLRFELGETRQFSYTLKLTDGRTSSGTMVLAIESVKKEALGDCQSHLRNDHKRHWRCRRTPILPDQTAVYPRDWLLHRVDH